jgi:hypothetical protein
MKIVIELNPMRAAAHVAVALEKTKQAYAAEKAALLKEQSKKEKGA